MEQENARSVTGQENPSICLPDIAALSAAAQVIVLSAKAKVEHKRHVQANLSENNHGASFLVSKSSSLEVRHQLKGLKYPSSSSSGVEFVNI